MSINRVDVQGTFIRQDVAQVRQEEENRTYADMTRLASQFEQEAEENHIAVTQTEAYERGDEKYDASEEGKNKHLLNNAKRGKTKKKREEEMLPDPDGVIIGPDGKPMNYTGVRHASFDLKI
ncbi:MAG: hypothetical protein K6G16_04630 [Lachnospiraceae bacterium]|nr:hypothetical protein [Lachnospiraceae bacterium]